MTVKLPEVIRQQVDVVPAQPDFNLITQVLGEDFSEVVDVAREPIIAWRIQTETYEHHDGEQHIVSNTIPITVEHDCARVVADAWAVEYPDGRCDLPCDSIFESAAGLLEYWRRFYQKHDPRQLSIPFMDDGEPKDERS